MRRSVVGALLAALVLGTVPARGQDTIVSHGLSAFGDLKYPKDFAHFDYVNPEAPKGGKLNTMPTSGLTSFDSFNGHILKGDAAEGPTLAGSEPQSLLYDALMVSAGDEPDAVYGLVAYEAEYPPDRSWVRFRLRDEARFHDGSALTADDVVFSFEVLKEKGHPIIRQNLRDVLSAEAAGPHEVIYRFAEGVVTRDLPLVVATLPIFSADYYATRPFDQSTLEPLLGSGPYRLGRFKQGTFVEWDRVEDYWARDQPVNIGRWNFDRIRFDYFRDRDVAFQAFTANEYDLREEFTSRIWATQYDFPAVKFGKVILTAIPDENPSGVQGWYFNTRHDKFADRRVREAIALAFDFEWTNKTMFYGLYERTRSYFQGSPVLEASGAPGPGELALLEPFRENVPPSVFESVYVPPQTDGSGNNRDGLRRAQELLSAAGWRVNNGALTNDEGVPLTVEFLIYESVSERINAPFIANLKLLGIEAASRMVDPAQYQRRLEEFDFDITTQRYVQSNTPGIELRNFFGSASADLPGSRNLSGMRDPVVDSLIESVIGAKTRMDLIDAVHALDRVLRASHYWVPEWYKATHHIAYWDKFGYPDVKPKYQRGVLDTWWSKSVTASPQVN